MIPISKMDLFIFYYLCMSLLPCVYLYVPCTCLILAEARKENQIWNWSYRQLSITTWVLETEFSPLGNEQMFLTIELSL